MFESVGVLGWCSGRDDNLMCLLEFDVLDKPDPVELDCEGALVTRTGRVGNGVLSVGSLVRGANAA
jgi:hypothetical protein